MARKASASTPMPHCAAKLPANIVRLTAVFERPASADGKPSFSTVNARMLAAAPKP